MSHLSPGQRLVSRFCVVVFVGSPGQGARDAVSRCRFGRSPAEGLVFDFTSLLSPGEGLVFGSMSLLSPGKGLVMKFCVLSPGQGLVL
jgi:hypothetical protein